MTESSYYWSGTTLGDATLAPYDDDEFSDNWALMFTYDRTVQGVIDTDDTAYSNKLACTNPAGTTIRIAKGAAMIDGKIYKNTADVDFAVVAPGAGTNYYLVVARKTWATQLVRLAMLGPSAVATPTVTQTDGTLWEIPLWEVEITAAGAITITDVRVYAGAQVRATRRFFVPCVGGMNFTDATPLKVGQSPLPCGYIMPDNKFSYGLGFSCVPNDFLSAMTITPLILYNFAGGPGNVYIENYTLYGTAGESYSGTHNADSGYVAVGVVTDVRKAATEVQLSLTSAAIGDFISLQLRRDATDPLDTLGEDLYFQGWLVEYVGRL